MAQKPHRSRAMKERPISYAALAAIFLIGAAVLVNMWIKSNRSAGSAESVNASAVAVETLSRSIQDAGPIEKLSVNEVEGILIIKGKTRNRAEIERVSRLAKDQGFDRVANLIQLAPMTDDDAIEREIERTLGTSPSLQGCRFSIESRDGVVTLTGVVQREMQKDLARDLTKRQAGVKEVRAELRTL